MLHIDPRLGNNRMPVLYFVGSGTETVDLRGVHSN